MITLNDLENVHDSDSWRTLKEEIKADIDNENKESTQKKKMIIKKKCIERCFGIETRSHSFSVEEEKEEYLIRHEKKQKTGNGKKQKTRIKKNQKKQRQKRSFDLLIELTTLGLEPLPDMLEVFKNHIENLVKTDIKLVIQAY
ncbi:hypothetical protein QQP08_017466 [Theobroma cacao]|nr:hypothetical protein QQP08_017466 [Theobroma cacao]